ncbi:MAG TPA: caspase family protein [Streptomyces sp.]|nr:caspase family protein [Streptomyces sp.]
MPLPDPSASRAVLIGVDTYDDLADLPAVANNVERLAALLTADDVWGLPPQHLTVLTNPTSKDDVLDAVHTAATEAEDALLFYFAGHGLLTVDADLRLALPHTDTERLYRGVAYDDIRELVAHTGRPRARVVILDCCYSGSALTGYMGAAHGIAHRTMAEGTYVMTASAETKPAMAPPGEKYTAFTGELLRVIEEGVPGGPDPLPMDVLFTEVRDRLAARPGIPVPQQRARNAGHAITLVRNRSRTRPAEEAAAPPPPEEITPVRPPLLGRLAGLLHPLLVIAAVVSLPFAVTSSALPGGSDDRCGRWTVPEYGDSGPCVGVSDGSHSFMSELDSVSRAIAGANAAIPDGAPFVTIALLAPLISYDDVDIKRIVHQVQGAYAAQRRINDAGATLYVRLVLADPGMWSVEQKVTDQLAKMAVSKEHNLRAVVGFDGYDEANREAVRALTDRGIPAIAGPFTPNEPDDHRLGNRPIAWIMPSAEDQASALAASEAKGAVAERRSILVWNVNDSGYAQDLRIAFREHLEETVHDTARYRYIEDDEETEGQFTRIADQMCKLPRDVDNVLFAGDRTDLRDFLRAVGNRGCQRREFTIVTGSGASALHRDPDLDWGALRGGVTVEYTSGAHPDGSKGHVMEDLRNDVEELESITDPVDLTDGEAIAAYDSTLTAAYTIRHVAGSDGRVPNLAAVAAGLLDMRFEAATGRICLDERGRASGKAVHVLRLDPDRRAPRLIATEYPGPGGCG